MPLPKLTIEDCHRVANERDGECLDKMYINSKTQIRWKCKKGHEWSATFNHIKNHKTWCLKCFIINRKDTLEECKKIAEEHMGKCLSIEYMNNRTKMKWRCKDGHEWNATFNDIKNSHTWCPNCNWKKLTLDKCKRIAIERGGKCLSTEYINNATKMKWQCKKEHKWDAIFGQIKNRNTWCPYCLHKEEQKVRGIIEDITGLSFLISRPHWLKPLSLDGYCEEKKIAFEYQGRQHYDYIPEWHKNGLKDLYKQQGYDKKKEQLCKENGVKLIIIPYWIKDDDLREFIRNQTCTS